VTVDRGIHKPPAPRHSFIFTSLLFSFPSTSHFVTTIMSNNLTPTSTNQLVRAAPRPTPTPAPERQRQREPSVRVKTERPESVSTLLRCCFATTLTSSARAIPFRITRTQHLSLSPDGIPGGLRGPDADAA
jgi:hypothetical protein